MASASAASFSEVDVPWALIWRIADGSIPASARHSSMQVTAPLPPGDGAVMWYASASLALLEPDLDLLLEGVQAADTRRHDDALATGVSRRFATGVVEGHRRRCQSELLEPIGPPGLLRVGEPRCGVEVIDGARRPGLV